MLSVISFLPHSPEWYFISSIFSNFCSTTYIPPLFFIGNTTFAEVTKTLEFIISDLPQLPPTFKLFVPISINSCRLMLLGERKKKNIANCTKPLLYSCQSSKIVFFSLALHIKSMIYTYFHFACEVQKKIEQLVHITQLKSFFNQDHTQVTLNS